MNPLVSDALSGVAGYSIHKVRSDGGGDFKQGLSASATSVLGRMFLAPMLPSVPVVIPGVDSKNALASGILQTALDVLYHNHSVMHGVQVGLWNGVLTSAIGDLAANALQSKGFLKNDYIFNSFLGNKEHGIVQQ